MKTSITLFFVLLFCYLFRRTNGADAQNNHAYAQNYISRRGSQGAEGKLVPLQNRYFMVNNLSGEFALLLFSIK